MDVQNNPLCQREAAATEDYYVVTLKFPSAKDIADELQAKVDPATEDNFDSQQLRLEAIGPHMHGCVLIFGWEDV